MQLPVRSGAAFRALADDTRRAIIETIAERPLPVHEIAQRFAISRPAVSKHLRILAEAGLVRPDRRGKENVYALDPRPLGPVREWLERYWAARLTTLKDLAERKH
jgi:DNA-binding transcriptional ArsR family regulator